ncbi:MAG: DinB family protein [Ilumatobacteraceae bacterium]
MITPDTKNWTWVLERRCPDCGFDAGSFNVARTGEISRDLARRWSHVLDRPDAAVRDRPEMWSPLEYGCHVRDVFRLFDRRLESMLSEGEPRFDNWDQDKTAVEDDYQSQEGSVVKAELVSAADVLADRFDAVTGDQWLRTGIRSDGALFTIRTFAQYLMHDPIHHLWDVGAELPAM